MSTINDKATVTLFVNGEQAEETLARLKKRAEELQTELDAANQAGDMKKVKQLTKELDKISRDMNRTETAMKGVGIVMHDLENTSIFGLKNALRQLQREIAATKPGTEKWQRHAEEIQRVKDRIAELNEELEESTSIWDKLTTFANDIWPVFDLLSRGYDSIIDTLSGFVDAYAEMDQEMANVRKFTGMTESQVRMLNEEFKKIDTRTSREELNKLAQEAGRLGKTSVLDVLGFVRAADKINVALDDLGQGATLTLSKLTGIFGDEERYGTEQSLLKVGSVINELSQNCSAAAPYLSNFTERLGGVGSQAGMTIQQIMGFAAVLDSNAQKVEASATALSQVIVRLYQEPAKYAKVAGLDVDNFTNLLKTDTNAALILFLETLQKAGGMDVLSPMFKDMGENGSRAIAALSSLAKHIDQVKAQQDAANIAFEEGTSIDNEFAVQNGTVQAALEKCKNHAHELQVELGERLQPIMRHLLVSSSSIIRSILTLINYIDEHKASVIAIASAITAYIAIAKLHELWLNRIAIKTVLVDKATKALTFTQKALSGVVAVARVGVAALTNAFAYLKNGLEVNLTMQERWRAAMDKMKFSTWAGLILAVATAVYLLYNRITSLTAAQKALQEAENQANKEIADTVTKIKTLQGIIEDNNRTLWERHKAIVALRSIMDEYNGELDEEGRLINHNTELIDTYIKKLRERALAAAMEDQLKQSFARLVEQGLVFLKDAKGDQVEQFKSDLLSGNISADMYMRGRRVRGGDSAGMSGVRSYAPSGEYDGMRSSAWAIALPWVEDDSYSAIQKFNEELGVFLTLSDQVDENTRRSLVQDDNTTPQVNQQRYESDEAYRTAVDELQTTLTAAISAAGDDQQRKDAAEYQYQLGLHQLNTTRAGHTPDEPDPEPDLDPTQSPDRFAKEDAWKEREEALARISYARGEFSYSDHTARMDEIAVEYYNKLLERTDLSENERLSIQAQYWEAVNKRTIAGNKQLIDDENSSYQQTLYALNENYRIRLERGNLSAQEREQVEHAHQEAVELAELNHLARLVEMYKEGSAERLQAQEAYQAAQIKAQQRHQQEYEKQEADYAKYKEKFFGDNPEEKQQKYDAAFAVLQTVYARELAAAGENADEKLRIEEAFLQAQAALRQQYGQETEDDTRNSYQKAITGFNDWLQGDGGKALTGTLSYVNQQMSSTFSALSSLVQAEMQIQTAQIEKKYDREIELAQGNSYKVATLEKKKETEIAKAKNNANKKLFAMQVIQAVAQSVQAGLNAYSSTLAIPIVGPALAPAAMALALATGAIQIAAIKKQQQASEAQGYAEGGFTGKGGKYEPAGIVHRGEWVASQKLLANPVARPMIEALDYAQRTNTIGTLRAEDVSRSITANQSLVRLSETDNGSLVMAAVASQISAAVADLTERLREPFVTVNTVTGDHGIKQVQEEYARMMSNKSSKNYR